MRCRLIIFGVLAFVLSLWIQPGGAQSDSLKEPAAVPGVAPVSGAVPAAATETPGGAESGQDGQDRQQPVNEPPPKYIYIRHIRTYDFPQNQGNPDEPRKIFVLELQTDPGKPLFYGARPFYSDIILDTNVGFGIMRDTFGSSEEDKSREIEIACYPLRTAPDDCSPEAVVIYNADAAFDRYFDQSHARTDIMDVLRRDADVYRRFGASKGFLPPASAGKGKKGKAREKIRMAYLGGHVKYDSMWGMYFTFSGVRLTFPPGQLKPHDKVWFLVRQWPEEDEPSEGFRDPRMPDAVELWLKNNYSEIDQDYLPDYLPAGLRGLDYKFEFIHEAYLVRKGKKINILPLLVEDSFRMLPIHGPDGLLPLGPDFNEYWGPKTP